MSTTVNNFLAEFNKMNNLDLVDCQVTVLRFREV